MKINKQYLFLISTGLIILFFIWFFSEFFFMISTALILSMVGSPIVNYLNKIKIGKFYLPKVLPPLITLLIFISLIVIIFLQIIPVLINEARLISNIDLKTITLIFQKPISDVEIFLRQYRIIGQDETLSLLLSEKIMKLLQMIDITKVVSYSINFAGSVFIALFAILFITFFFLKDSHLFNKAVMAFTPVEYQTEVKHILISTRKLISRYFIGLFTEIVLMTLLLWIGLMIIGISNAFLIAFIGGIMVIIPYLGFIIGAVVGLVFGITSALSVNLNADIMIIALRILSVYGLVKLIDDFMLQPFIYSNSVKAHPLEIFLIILISGHLAGITGMILAIPVYTFLRIIAKEFFFHINFVNKLTKNL